MTSLKTEDLLSDVETLPSSGPPSPPHSAGAALLTVSQSNWPLQSSSWPSSPLPALASSSQVTARLYASLQKSSRDLQLKGLSASGSVLETLDRPRQVTFNLSSPDLRSEREVPTPLSLSSTSKQLEESREAASCSPAPPSARLFPGGSNPVEGSPEEGGPSLELGQLAEEMTFNLQNRVDSSSASVMTGRRHIEDMESVRSHLQTILRTARDSTEPEQGSSILSSCVLPERLRLDNESFETDSTAHLISAPVLADVSPPLSVSGLEELFPRYSRLRPDGAPLSAETQLLQNSLERERGRRKHLERQTQALQNKALQLQQQLALAVSADRKKDIMIEQLDKTLAKVVEGWRRHEEEKSAGVRRLQEQKEAAEQAQLKQQEVLLRFEQSLAQAAETLDQEQKRAEELRISKGELEQQLAVLSEQLREQEQQNNQAREQVKQMRLHAEDAQAGVIREREAWASSERELQERLSVLGAELEQEKNNRAQEVQLLQEVRGRLQQLEGELEEVRRERDGVRMDRALDQARFESQCSQLEVEHKLSVEQQVTERLAALQEENSRTLTALREQHRKQLLDLRAHHERELSAQQEQHRTQLQEREERQRELAEEYEKRISVKQEEVELVEASRRKLEAQRTDLVTRLQQLMRSHWAEALRLLTLQGQMDGGSSPSSLHDRAMSRSRSEGDSSSSRGWEAPPRLNGPWDESSPESKQPSEVPQALALQLSRERGELSGDLSSQNSSPPGPLSLPPAPEREVSVLLNHSRSFRPLEPQLDDTALTGLGSYEMEELSARALSGGEESGYSMERGRQPKGSSRERAYSSERERAERGHSSDREEHSGYRGHRGGRRQSGYSSAAERECPGGYGFGAEGSRRGAVSGHSTAQDKEGRYRANKCAPPPLMRSTVERVEQVGMVRDGSFPFKDCRLGREGRGTQGNLGVQGREFGRPVTTQSLRMSGTEFTRDTSHSRAGGSQAEERFSRDLGGRGLERDITTTQGLGRRGDALSDLGTTHRPLVHTAQAASPDAREMGRQSELQYYITKLLDRSPGDPVDSSAADSALPPAGQSLLSAKPGLGSSWDSGQTKAPPGKPVSSLQLTSFEAAKTSRHPPGPVEPSSAQPSLLSPLTQADSALSSQMLGQLSHLLSQNQAEPDSVVPSLEELLAHLISSQTSRTLQGPGAGHREEPVHRAQEQRSGPAAKKEQTALPAADRRSQTSRPAGGEKTQPQAQRIKRTGPQAQRGPSARGNVWR